MQKIIGIICAAIAVGGLCLGLAGCTKEADGLRGDGQVVLMQMSVDSRAVSETDGTPSAEEAALHSLRAYAFVGGQPAGHFYYEGTDITASYNFLMVFYHHAGDRFLCRSQRGRNGDSRRSEGPYREYD